MSPGLVVDRKFIGQLKRFLAGSFPGSFLQPVKVSEWQGSSLVQDFSKDLVCDQFKIQIPYAGQTLVWEACFDSNCPEQAPDFIFDDESFTAFLNIDLLCERVPSLVNWNIKNPECLKNVLQELINLYTFYQLKRLETEGSSLSEEISKLMQELELDENQLQVFAGNLPASPQYYESSSRNTHSTVRVMLLDLEKKFSFEKIPEQYRRIALQFTYQEYSPTSVALHINPSLEHILGETKDYEAPNYVKSDGLQKYFHLFHRVFQETLEQVCQSYERRENLQLSIMFDLLACEVLSVTPLEYDMLHWTSTSYMVEMDGYPVLVIVQTPNQSHANANILVKTLSGCEESSLKDFEEDPRKVVEGIIEFINELKEGNLNSIG